MATNVKILLRRGLRNELAGDTLSAGEMGYTTDTNQLYVGVEEAINELRFDPFANAHAVIQSWLDSADCPVSGLTVDEDLVVADIPSGQIDNIIELHLVLPQPPQFSLPSLQFYFQLLN